MNIFVIGNGFDLAHGLHENIEYQFCYEVNKLFWSYVKI